MPSSLVPPEYYFWTLTKGRKLMQAAIITTSRNTQLRRTRPWTAVAVIYSINLYCKWKFKTLNAPIKISFKYLNRSWLKCFYLNLSKCHYQHHHYHKAPKTFFTSAWMTSPKSIFKFQTSKVLSKNERSRRIWYENPVVLLSSKHWVCFRWHLTEST